MIEGLLPMCCSPCNHCGHLVFCASYWNVTAKDRPSAGVTDRCVEFVGSELACGAGAGLWACGRIGPAGVGPSRGGARSGSSKRSCSWTRRITRLRSRVTWSSATVGRARRAHASGDARCGHRAGHGHVSGYPEAVAELAAFRAQLAGEPRAMGVVCHAARVTGAPGQTAPACEGASSLTCRNSVSFDPRLKGATDVSLACLHGFARAGP